MRPYEPCVRRLAFMLGVSCAVATSACTNGDDDGAAEPPVISGNGLCRGIALPEDRHFVADGLCASAVAVDQGPLRQIAFASNGDLLGVTAGGEIRRYRDLDGDGTFLGQGEVARLGATGANNGNNAHFDEQNGYLYAGTRDGVSRWVYSEGTDALGDPEAVVVDQPYVGTHPLHTAHVYDHYLYVHSGSEDNAVAPAAPEYDTNRSVLKRFDLDAFAGAPFAWSEGEVVMLGVRNMVGFTRNAAGRMYGVINGIDDLMFDGADIHLDNPGDDLVRIEPGAAHGYPYCFTAVNVTDTSGARVPPGTPLVSATNPAPPDPDFTNPNTQEWCDENADEPETFLPAHSAPLDIVFLDEQTGSLPDEWQGGAFVSLHGSWNTMPSVGHKVVFIPFDADGGAEMPEASAEGTRYPFEVVFGGGTGSAHADGAWGWANGSAGENPVRPVGLAISPADGALYVSSDNAGPAKRGALYRIARRED
jgi:glucose/arabinose dehydrogenase